MVTPFKRVVVYLSEVGPFDVAQELRHARIGPWVGVETIDPADVGAPFAFVPSNIADDTIVVVDAASFQSLAREAQAHFCAVVVGEKEIDPVRGYRIYSVRPDIQDIINGVWKALSDGWFGGSDVLWIVDDDRSRFRQDGTWGVLIRKWARPFLCSYVSPATLVSDEITDLMSVWKTRILVPLGEGKKARLTAVFDRQFGNGVGAADFGEHLSRLVANHSARHRCFLATSFNVVAEATLGRRAERLFLLGDKLSDDDLNCICASAESEQGSSNVERLSEILLSGLVSPLNRDNSGIVGESAAIVALKEKITRLAQLRLPVLITGETGTGKELVARELYNKWSCQSKGEFVKVDMGSVTPGLVGSELFGHVAGSFTDAKRDREGAFRAANGGFVFLDEIGKADREVQARLLRVIQEGKVKPIGGDKDVDVNVRVVAAANEKLDGTGEFREDLLNRLRVFEVNLPPLRERGSDIVLLARKFAERQRKILSAGAAARLLLYTWSGNVRELEHVIIEASALAVDETLRAEHLAARLPLLPSVDECRKGLVASAVATFWRDDDLIAGTGNLVVSILRRMVSGGAEIDAMLFDRWLRRNAFHLAILAEHGETDVFGNSIGPVDARRRWAERIREWWTKQLGRAGTPSGEEWEKLLHTGVVKKFVEAHGDVAWSDAARDGNFASTVLDYMSGARGREAMARYATLKSELRGAAAVDPSRELLSEGRLADLVERLCGDRAVRNYEHRKRAFQVAFKKVFGGLS